MKLLTILNTIAIVILFYFGYQSGIFNGFILDEEVTEQIVEEIEDEIVEGDEESSLGIKPGEQEEEEEDEGTLTLDDSYRPNGFVDLTGYMMTESVFMFGENVDQAFFVFNEASDDDVKVFIDELVNVGNSVNRKVGGTYFLGLGCDTGDAVDNLNFNVTGDNYWALKGSDNSAKITLRAFFNNEIEGGVGGACLSYAETVQVVDEV